MNKRLYYMHPVNTYGTDLEREQLALLARLFPEWDVVSPNAPEHVTAYERMKKETGNGMPYFTELAAGCDGGVLLPFRDGKIGAGVFKEAQTLAQKGLPVWELTFDGMQSSFSGDASRALSVEETRKRIRNADGSPLPY